jgi:DNA-directed RNA polymerase subunit H (RpoH/RPB5)
MYSKILIFSETKHILKNIMEHHLLDTHKKQEILTWYDITTKQIYLINNNNIVIRFDGLAMGPPSSSTLSEIFLQRIKHLNVTHLTQKHKIINYFWYVDDILLIFDVNRTNIQAILEDFNTLYLDLHFTADIEQNNIINYLDISIHKTHSNIKISICRKPTFTDTIIPHSTNNPIKQKYAAIRSYITDWTHTSYTTKNTARKKILFTISFKIAPSQSGHKNL